ncbi:N-acetyltransferase family protein [Glaciecola sp. SC05]|uniref:GNAT family N-acetyltransferase n=1 Tax=Glaciecola sp. SC05 TaxID=1987355 RepID=UPI0035277F7E
MSEVINKDHTLVQLGNLAITIRPITPDDKDIEAAFVHDLSMQTKYERFFEGIKDLSPYMLKKLCEVDGVNTMAFVATINVDGAEKEIGVCRYALDKTPSEREMAVTVADNYPFEEIASLLIDKIRAHAKQNNIKRLNAIELSSNYRMLQLAKHLGMTSKIAPTDSTLVVYSINA